MLCHLQFNAVSKPSRLMKCMEKVLREVHMNQHLDHYYEVYQWIRISPPYWVCHNKTHYQVKTLLQLHASPSLLHDRSQTPLYRIYHLCIQRLWIILNRANCA